MIRATAQHFRKPAFLLCLLLSLLSVSAIAQQNKKRTRMLLMLDCSGSMNGFLGRSNRMDVAKKLINRMVDSLKDAPDVDLALRSYGAHAKRGKQDCTDTKLEVHFEPDNYTQIKKALNLLEPNGTTPIAYSLMRTQDDFPADRSQNIVILITDGFEECDGDPCAVSRTLQGKNITLKPFIIGIGLNDVALKSFECVGRVYNAKTEKDFSEILNTVVTQALNNTTVEVDLKDESGKPKETDVNLTFYNSKTHEVVVNYYHTLNPLGRPDTFKLDPVLKYDLQVNTTPIIWKKNIDLKPAAHNIISLDAAQGNLKLVQKSAGGTNSVKSLIREAYHTEVVYIQDVNTTHRYLTGNYDLEVLTLPRTYYRNVQVSEKQTNTIDIPEAGKLDLTNSKEITGSIFIIRESGEIEWVTDLIGKGQENYTLQPGNYRIIYRAKAARQTEESVDKEFTITSGNRTTLQLN